MDNIYTTFENKFWLAKIFQDNFFNDISVEAGEFHGDL